jgi:predicted histone-like DNA-binding protein
MSQKFRKLQNKNSESTAYGKWFATAVYDQNFIGTKELSQYIQDQCSMKESDVGAVLNELGKACQHYFKLGQKVKLDGIGIFKVGFSSVGATTKDDCGAQNITKRRIIFTPETERIVVGQKVNKKGQVVQKYVIAKTLIKDVVFEETHDTALKSEANSGNAGSGGEGGNG